MTLQAKDAAVRAMTNDGAFRIVTLRTTSTARGAARAQAAPHHVAPLFAELLTGALLIRQTMSPDFRVQASLRRREGGSLFADAHADGTTRGLVNLQDAPGFTLGPQTLLQVVRVLKNGELHQGVVETVAEAGLSGSLTSYMVNSEQVTSVIGVGSITRADDGEFVHVGGYIVQLLPGAEQDALRRMTEHLETLPPIERLLDEAGGDPHALLDLVLGDYPAVVFEEVSHDFGCNCSEDRVVRALGSMGPEEIVAIIERDEVLEIDCDYCRAHYRIEPTQLRDLLR